MGLMFLKAIVEDSGHFAHESNSSNMALAPLERSGSQVIKLVTRCP